MSLHQGQRAAAWRGRMHHCTASAENQTSTASWCKLTTQGMVINQYDDVLSFIIWRMVIYLYLSLAVAVIIAMSGSMAIVLASQRRWQMQSGSGTAWDAEVTGKNKPIFISCQMLFMNIYIYDHLYKQTLSFFFCPPSDKYPSLEIKYRSKKSREKDVEPERAERQYSTPSTPEYRSERRRGSKVMWKSFF